MSRLTGKEVYSLMEAYQAVYTPQELTEEQVWEGVENWVHSLLEEGYDLSDYTWEEMYEAYLGEGPYDAANVQRVQQVAQDGQAKRDAAAATLKAQRRSQDVTDYRQAMLPPKQNTMDGRYATPGTQRGNQDKYKSTSDGKMYANYNDALAANRSRNKNTITPGLPKVNQRPGAPVPPVRPVPGAPAPSVRPVPSAPAPSVRPAPAAPAPRPAATPEKPMGGDPMDQWARANPTLAARVKPGSSGYNTIKARLDADNDRQENYDAYDLVFSYLINEGYANTQDSALAIMANMSEDWKRSIVEAKKT